jgi:maltose alpha-D-glucosyltransferase/alpha-amylase
MQKAGNLLMAEQNPLWYKNAVFYEVYLRAFYDSNADGHGDIPGLIQKLDYLKGLGVDCLWLLPIYPSPLKDDGYDISDYYNIAPTFGTLDDFRVLVRAVHTRGMRLITDLVLNHTSDQHAWFQAARQDRRSAYRDYYVWSDNEQKYADARIIFLDTEKSNWTWDEQAGQFFWHRFYSSQPDLNFDNPAVQREMLNVMKFWLDLGVDGFRADAVPYLFEREGTNGENLPETHQYLKRLRHFMDDNYPGRILLCEANQWPEDARAYFGDGDEFHMGFHFPLMPRLFMALRQHSIAPLKWILKRTPPIPADCQWCIFLRNHDELTLEMVTEEERQWMWQEYAPEPRMRLNLGIRRRLAPLLDNDQRLVELVNSLLFSLPGTPIIYYGDEIGMGDNILLFDRNGVRTPMQWENARNAGFSSAAEEMLFTPLIPSPAYGPSRVNVRDQLAGPGSLYHKISKMIAVRKQQPVFGSGGFDWAGSNDDAVAAYWRMDVERRLLVLNNLSPVRQMVEIGMSEKVQMSWVELLSSRAGAVPARQNLTMTLEPYEYLWLMFD